MFLLKSKRSFNAIVQQFVYVCVCNTFDPTNNSLQLFVVNVTDNGLVVTPATDYEGYTNFHTQRSR